MRKYRKFGGELKAQIVLEVLQHNNIIEVAKKHEISTALVMKWKEQFLDKARLVFEDKTDQEMNKKLKHYEHIITKITTQNDFLEKVLAVVK